MIEFGFVILHYIAYEMTKRCVDTLLRTLSKESFHIVVVDNGSGNDTGNMLRKDYESLKEVTVLLNDSNMGFAKGNNLGYRYLKQIINPEYIIVMNNDVIIDDSAFCSKIKEIDNKWGFAVLGPDIQNPLIKNHQNPERLKPRDYSEVKKRIKKFGIKNNYPHTFYCLSKIKSIFSGNTTEASDSYGYENMAENVVLHGACYIFSSSFCKVRDDCFNPRTFLYHEEDILYYECHELNLKMLYSPSVYVKHYEDVSTDASFNSDYRKQVMRNKWLKESAEVLLDVMEKADKRGL